MNNLFPIRKAFQVFLSATVVLFPSRADVSTPLLITPGYGVSDYFQLMPGKVKSGNFIGQHQQQSRKKRLSIRLFSNAIHVDYQEAGRGLCPTMCLYTISGRFVYRFAAGSNGALGNENTLALPCMSSGVYVAIADYDKERAQMKFVYTAR